MPLYEYKCDRCETVFEVIQKFADPPLTVHEICGGSVNRLISTSALQFKGSGFYITDYKKSGGKEAKVPNAKSGESAGSKSDSAAAPKADSSSSTAAPSATPAPAAPATSSPAASTESKK